MFRFGFVFVSAKMKDSVGENAFEFFFKIFGKGSGIVGNAGQRYENIAAYGFALYVVESDDIGVIIVLKIVLIYFQKIVVIAENIVDFAEFFLFGNDDVF